MKSLTVKKTKYRGRGIFANRNFKKGEKILDIKGKIITLEQLKKLGKYALAHHLQLNENICIGPSKDLDDLINHSCDPNAGIKIRGKKAILISIRNIKRGEEITCDYSTITDDDWKMRCKCGCENCRKTIKKFQTLPKKLQQKYIKLGVVAKYIYEK